MGYTGQIGKIALASRVAGDVRGSEKRIASGLAGAGLLRRACRYMSQRRSVAASQSGLNSHLINRAGKA
jgi:hypothetical protein